MKKLPSPSRDAADSADVSSRRGSKSRRGARMASASFARSSGAVSKRGGSLACARNSSASWAAAAARAPSTTGSLACGTSDCSETAPLRHAGREAALSRDAPRREPRAPHPRRNGLCHCARARPHSVLPPASKVFVRGRLHLKKRPRFLPRAWPCRVQRLPATA